MGRAGIGVDVLALTPLAAFPASPQEGMIVCLAADGLTYQYTGGAWQPFTSGAYLTKGEADGFYRQKPTYVHHQGVAASVWTVNHNLGSNPLVTSFDSADTQVEGSVTYIDLNSLTVNFSFAFSGKAFLG